MPNTREIIAVAGVGDLGKYICEELVASDKFDVIVLSRGVSLPNLQSDFIIARKQPTDTIPWI